MSKQDKIKQKIDRGTSLSREQYSLIFNYLKSGQKPTARELKNAGLTGTLNGGLEHPNTSTYFRFKSIAKRLRIRVFDEELVFKTNNKIVLPNNRFQEVIRLAHRNNGQKHLNITRTMEKLSEDYTVGCRQFGICEATVRMVVKKCREGPCGRKPRPGLSVKKSVVKSPEKTIKEKILSKTSTSTPTKSVASNRSSACKMPSVTPNISAAGITVSSTASKCPQGIQQPLKLGIPVQVVRLPTGHFALQQMASPGVSQSTTFQPMTSHGFHHSNPQVYPMDLTLANRQPINIPVQYGTLAEILRNTGNYISAYTRMPNLANILTSNTTPRLNVPQQDQDGIKNKPTVPQVVILSTNQARDHSVPMFNSSMHGYVPPITRAPVDINNNILSETDDHIIINNLTGTPDPGQYLNKHHTPPHSDWYHITDHQGSDHVAMETNSQAKVIDLTGSDTDLDSHAAAGCYGNIEADMMIDGSQDSVLDGSSYPEKNTLPYNNSTNSNFGNVNRANPYDHLLKVIASIKPDIHRALAGSVSARYKLKLSMSSLEQMLAEQRAMCSMYMHQE